MTTPSPIQDQNDALIFQMVDLTTTASVDHFFPREVGRGQKMVPKHILGCSNDYKVVFQNIRRYRQLTAQEQEQEWKDWRVLSQKMKEEFKSRIPKYREPIPEEPMNAATETTSSPAIAAPKPDKMMTMEDLPPLDEGQTYYTPSAVVKILTNDALSKRQVVQLKKLMMSSCRVPVINASSIRRLLQKAKTGGAIPTQWGSGRPRKSLEENGNEGLSIPQPKRAKKNTKLVPSTGNSQAPHQHLITLVRYKLGTTDLVGSSTVIVDSSRLHVLTIHDILRQSFNQDKQSGIFAKKDTEQHTLLKVFIKDCPASWSDEQCKNILLSSLLPYMNANTGEIVLEVRFVIPPPPVDDDLAAELFGEDDE